MAAKRRPGDGRRLSDDDPADPDLLRGRGPATHDVTDFAPFPGDRRSDTVPPPGGWARDVGATQPHYGHRGKGPRGYQRDDQRLLEEVVQALTDDDELDASEIQVHVDDAEVTLEGTVADRADKRRAERLADSVMGVLDVHNRLRLRAK